MSSPTYAPRGDLLAVARTMSDEQISAEIHRHLLSTSPFDRVAVASLRYVQTERMRPGYNPFWSSWGGTDPRVLFPGEDD